MMDKSTSCGLFNWRPDWMQKFASRKYYLILYAIIGTVQGMTFSYLNVVLSTIEKRFGLKSKEAAWVYSGNEISQIFFVVFMPFVGRVKKRPLFMALSTALAAAGVFIISIPHFTGDQSYLNDAINANNESDWVALCQPNVPRHEECEADLRPKDWNSMWVVFFGIFLLGIATSFYYSFGLPYVDDNSTKNDSPFYLSLVMAARTVGPAFGYALGSACLTIYVDPQHLPDGLTDNSPHWIGAWWIGFIVIGFALAITSPWLSFFPQRLPIENTDSVKIEKERSSESEPQSAREWIKELTDVSKRLLIRPIYVLNLLSSTVFLLGIVGYFTFFPKYIEFHFRLKASTVGATGGLFQALSAAAGILASGFIMKKFRLGARPLAAWCCLADLIFMMAFGVIALMSCPPLVMHGQLQETGLLQIDNNACNSNCDCSGVSYQPICSRDGVTNFFSPCHAGCRLVNATMVIGKKNQPTKKKLYWDCSCAEELFKKNPELSIADPWWKEIDAKNESLPSPLAINSNSKSPEIFSAAVDGYCPADCHQRFYALLAFMFVAGLIGASTRLPNMILSLRTIDKRDKAASITLSLSVLSLFAILPSPLVIGAIMDETCRVWGSKCGQTTSCLVYDIDKMRTYLAIFPAICIFIALLFDVGVWYHAKNLKVYDDEDENIDEVEKSRNISETTFTTDEN